MSSKYLRIFLLALLAHVFTSTAAFAEPTSTLSSTISSAVILQYHHISADTPASTSTSPERFLEHLTLLEELGFVVKSLPWLIQQIQQKRPIRDKTAVITFDDGYLSIYEKAYPLLKKRNWPFTIFISPEPILKGFGDSLNWQQLKEMQANGATLANHSFSHLHLLDRIKTDSGELESDDQWRLRIKQDIEQTQIVLEKHLGPLPKLLAYPYGEYDQQLQLLVKELGYIGLGQQSGPVGWYSDLTALPRFPAAGIYANPKTLKTKLLTLPFHLIENTTSTLLKTNDAPTLSFSVKPNGFRKHQIQCFYQGSLIDTKVIEKDNQIGISAKADELGKGRRHRYNCTAPSKNGQRYYWFSHPWLRS